MDSGCGWLLNGGVKFSVDVARRDVNGLLSSCRQNTPAPKSLGFPRSKRLTSEADLETVKRTGKRMQTERLEARALASLFSYPRVAIVVPKHRHKVVARNRVKRRLRELVRTGLLSELGRVDLLIRAKPEAYGSTFKELMADVAQIRDWASEIAR